MTYEQMYPNIVFLFASDNNIIEIKLQIQKKKPHKFVLTMRLHILSSKATLQLTCTLK